MTRFAFFENGVLCFGWGEKLVLGIGVGVRADILVCGLMEWSGEGDTFRETWVVDVIDGE